VSIARVLTVRQPWASAIIWAGKNVENRAWPTRYRGRLYIHAGMALEPDDVLPPRTPVPRGAIIGHVTLTGCVRDSPSPWAEPGSWHWLLTDPVPLAEPIAARGRLGLWQPPPGLAESGPHPEGNQ
jgi:ASCH domain